MTRILGKEFHKPDFRKTVLSEYFREMGLTKCDEKNTEVLSLASDEFHHKSRKNFPDGAFPLRTYFTFLAGKKMCFL